MNEYKLSRNSREKLITNLENENQSISERVKIIQSKYDESESRRVNLALELEELKKQFDLKDQDNQELEGTLTQL